MDDAIYFLYEVLRGSFVRIAMVWKIRKVNEAKSLQLAWLKGCEVPVTLTCDAQCEDSDCKYLCEDCDSKVRLVNFVLVTEPV